MRPIELLCKQLGRSVPSIHRIRLKAIMAAVESVLSDAPVTITSLGRCIANAALPKHKIKRMDLSSETVGCIKNVWLFIPH